MKRIWRRTKLFRQTCVRQLGSVQSDQIPLGKTVTPFQLVSFNLKRQTDECSFLEDSQFFSSHLIQENKSFQESQKNKLMCIALGDILISFYIQRDRQCYRWEFTLGIFYCCALFCLGSTLGTFEESWWSRLVFPGITAECQ